MPKAHQTVRQARWTPKEIMQVKQISSVRVSPDGKRVAFAVRRAVIEKEKSKYVTHIHVVNSDSSKPYQLTHGETSSQDPRWSPDGEWIAFTSNRSGKQNVWLIRVRGGEAHMLTDVETGVSSFQWSPDGEWIAFTALDPPEAGMTCTVKFQPQEGVPPAL